MSFGGNDYLTFSRRIALFLTILLLLPAVLRAAPLPLTPEEKTLLSAASAAARANAEGAQWSSRRADELLRRLAEERHPEPVPLLLAAGELEMLETYKRHLGSTCLPNLERYYLENYDNPAVVSRLPMLCDYQSPELMTLLLEDAMAAARGELPFSDQPLSTRRVNAVKLVTRSIALNPANLLPVLGEYEARLLHVVDYPERRAGVAGSSAGGYRMKQGYSLELPPLHLLQYGLEKGDKETERVVLRIGEKILSQGRELHSTDKVDEFARLVSSIRSKEATALSLRLLVFWEETSNEVAYRECGSDAQASVSALIDTYLETDGVVDLQALSGTVGNLKCINRTSGWLVSLINELAKEEAWEPQDRARRMIQRNTPVATLRAKALLDTVKDIKQVREPIPPLLTAANAGNYDMERYLLLRGVAVDTPSSFGETPLTIEAGRTDKLALERVSLLMAHGADVNGRKGFNTPLHVAARSGSPEVIELLLRSGARVNAEVNGLTPLDLALFRGRRDVVELLKARGGVRGGAPWKRSRVPKRVYDIAEYPAGCDWAGLCDRVENREADRIEVVSPREMRLIYESGKMLAGAKGEKRPERFIVTVRDHAVASGLVTLLEIVEKRGLVCHPVLLQAGRLCTYEGDGVGCEAWGSGERTRCPGLHR